MKKKTTKFIQYSGNLELHRMSWCLVVFIGVQTIFHSPFAWGETHELSLLRIQILQLYWFHLGWWRWKQTYFRDYIKEDNIRAFQSFEDKDWDLDWISQSIFWSNYTFKIKNISLRELKKSFRRIFRKLCSEGIYIYAGIFMILLTLSTYVLIRIVRIPQTRQIGKTGA